MIDHSLSFNQPQWDTMGKFHSIFLIFIFFNSLKSALKTVTPLHCTYLNINTHHHCNTLEWTMWWLTIQYYSTGYNWQIPQCTAALQFSLGYRNHHWKHSHHFTTVTWTSPHTILVTHFNGPGDAESLRFVHLATIGEFPQSTKVPKLSFFDLNHHWNHPHHFSRVA